MQLPPVLNSGNIRIQDGITAINYQMEAAAALAVRAAYAAGRPLLIRGEPGVGKTQLAVAVAQAWDWPILSKTVDSSTESRDLHYHFDDLARLGEAQTLAHVRDATAASILDPARYLSPGPLWWAFDKEGAAQVNQQSEYKMGQQPKQPADTNTGVVVLIDEIDKAEAELPNGLLETLGQRRFRVPHYPEPIEQQADQPAPLIIITTNEERELPAAFVRRCWVLKLALPNKKSAFIDQLKARGQAHFAKQIQDPTLYTKAAERLWDSRETARQQAIPLPGQAEYLDLLRAISTLATDAAGQRTLYKQVADYVMDKASYDPN